MIVGGLVGLNNARDRSSTRTQRGTVTGTGQVEFGGLVGGNFASISGSYAIGPGQHRERQRHDRRPRRVQQRRYDREFLCEWPGHGQHGQCQRRRPGRYERQRCRSITNSYRDRRGQHQRTGRRRSVGRRAGRRERRPDHKLLRDRAGDQQRRRRADRRACRRQYRQTSATRSPPAMSQRERRKRACWRARRPMPEPSAVLRTGNVASAARWISPAAHRLSALKAMPPAMSMSAAPLELPVASSGSTTRRLNQVFSTGTVTGTATDQPAWWPCRRECGQRDDHPGLCHWRRSPAMPTAASGGLVAVNTGSIDQTYAIGKLTGGGIIGGLVGGEQQRAVPCAQRSSRSGAARHRHRHRHQFVLGHAEHRRRAAAPAAPA